MSWYSDLEAGIRSSLPVHLGTWKRLRAANHKEISRLTSWKRNAKQVLKRSIRVKITSKTSSDQLSFLIWMPFCCFGKIWSKKDTTYHQELKFMPKEEPKRTFSLLTRLVIEVSVWNSSFAFWGDKARSVLQLSESVIIRRYSSNARWSDNILCTTIQFLCLIWNYKGRLMSVMLLRSK